MLDIIRKALKDDIIFTENSDDYTYFINKKANFALKALTFSPQKEENNNREKIKDKIETIIEKLERKGSIRINYYLRPVSFYKVSPILTELLINVFKITEIAIDIKYLYLLYLLSITNKIEDFDLYSDKFAVMFSNQEKGIYYIVAKLNIYP